jgi:metal-responsive CopG/Arc/MetJ family transcriptional regulator
MALLEKSVSTNPRAMGRPPLHMKATQVRLPERLMERIDAVSGTYGRAQFIREAVELELERREREAKRKG